MAGNILRKAGVVLLTLIKGILKAVLPLLKFTLGAAKIFLLLFALIARFVLILIGGFTKI